MNELDATQLRELQRILQVLQQELTLAIENDLGQSNPVTLDQQSVGRVSRIDAIQQQQMAKATRRQQQQQLRQVSRAIDELAQGDYGYCQQCGELIAFARLKVRPESVLCVRCQQELE